MTTILVLILKKLTSFVLIKKTASTCISITVSCGKKKYYVQFFNECGGKCILKTRVERDKCNLASLICFKRLLVIMQLKNRKEK